MPRFGLLLLFLAMVAAPSMADDSQLGLRLPSGFEVTEFAGPALANDIFSMAIDPRGRIVVSGRGYIRILVDDDDDGHADRAIDFTDGPADGAQGMLWEGTSLFVTGDGGLRRYRDENGDDRADGTSELIRAIKTGGEHDTHDIKRGSDGWLYVLCGNMTGIDKSFGQSRSSPIQDPVAGCVIRLSPDLKACEIVADGFRNAYRMDWNADGELFTYDSDNERCVSLPWYEPTRFYHVISGGHYGWLAPQRTQFWRMPPYFSDVVAPVAYLGRGSPTGVVCYRHQQFPVKFQSGFFVADWTFGRVWFLPLHPDGSSYSSKPEVFLEAVGENGFAPTDLAVHPTTGDLYIAIGGRGTRGAVYRVRHPARSLTANRPKTPPLGHLAPTSVWDPAASIRQITQATAGDDPIRLQSLQLVRRHLDHFNSKQIQQVIQSNWNHTDRYIRVATSQLIASLDDSERQELAKIARTPRERATCCFAFDRANLTEYLRADVGLFRSLEDDDRLATVRLLQLACGDIGSQSSQGTLWEGYTPRLGGRMPDQPTGQPNRSGNRGALDGLITRPWIAELRQAFPSGNANLDREIARTLGMIEDDDPAVLLRVADRVTDSSDPVEDIHYLAVLARLRAEWPAELPARIAADLLALDHKVIRRQFNRERHWPLRVAELHAELARKSPRMNEALVTDAAFGRPDHVLFASHTGFDRVRAAKIFVAKAASDSKFVWTPAVVELLSSLPEVESLVVLRNLWDNAALQDSIVHVLSLRPQNEDRDKFIHGLNSPQFDTVRECLAALEMLPGSDDATELLSLIRTQRRLQGGKQEEALRIRTGKLLQKLTDRAIAPDDTEGWSAWFVREFPALAQRLVAADGVDIEVWSKRLGQIDWSIGSSDRGQVVFDRAGCSACHSGASAVGPDLRGTAIRFSRIDLFTAILQPNRDVSPRYQSTLVATADGKVHQGVIIYEAVDSLILQTGADTTIRVTNNQIVERRVTSNSLMPAGLLDKLTDREISDLFAYLKTLR